jgi:hypothetical protein
MPRNDSRTWNAIIWIEIFELTGVHLFARSNPCKRPANSAFTMSKNGSLKPEARSQNTSADFSSFDFRR